MLWVILVAFLKYKKRQNQLYIDDSFQQQQQHREPIIIIHFETLIDAEYSIIALMKSKLSCIDIFFHTFVNQARSKIVLWLYKLE